MSAQPAEHDEPYEKIHLGGEEAAIVPMDELRRLRAIERRAPAEVIREAEGEEAGAGSERKRRARARWDEMLAQATPEQRARADRIAAHLAAQAARLPETHR